MKKITRKLIKPFIIPILFCMILSSCSFDGWETDHEPFIPVEEYVEENSGINIDVTQTPIEDDPDALSKPEYEDVQSIEDVQEGMWHEEDVVLSAITYNGNPYIIVNDNVPYFTEDDITLDTFETYSELDNLGRCGVAYANICQELMPTEKRESISNVKPSGWINKPYDFVDGGYIYNRCHLIGFQLAGENANELNLITGTRYMNVDGMLPFENMVADYVKETDNHVLYRITPIYQNDNLIADGVLMEAYSVEDNGDGILFNVFCYNVQPGCEIDYTNGDNWLSNINPLVSDSEENLLVTYILNENSKVFHNPCCSSVDKMNDKNRKEYSGSRDELIDNGYKPCGGCNP